MAQEELRIEEQRTELRTENDDEVKLKTIKSEPSCTHTYVCIYPIHMHSTNKNQSSIKEKERKSDGEKRDRE